MKNESYKERHQQKKVKKTLKNRIQKSVSTKKKIKFKKSNKKKRYDLA